MALTGIGYQLKKLREERGLSGSRLAKLADVDKRWLARVEAGEYHKPDPRLLYRLARVLGIDPIELSAAAGYNDGLPAFAPYLRTKYELSAAEVSELQAAFDRVNERHRQREDGAA